VARCYHRVCGRTFGGVTGFDFHLRLLQVPPWVECVNPADVGLTEVDGVWVRAVPPVGTPSGGVAALTGDPRRQGGAL
jgi:hypothetical protein